MDISGILKKVLFKLKQEQEEKMSVTKSKCYKLLSLSLVATLLMGIFVVSNTTTAEAKAPYDISAKISSILDDALDWIKYY